MTQFQRAMNQINGKLITAHSPQAKGRVERMNWTLQDRLVKELKLAGITTIEEANEFLEKFLPHKVVGVELSFFHVLCWKIKAKFKYSKVKFYYQDFFKTNINDADIIYLFLVESVMIKIWNKIKKEVKPGTIMIVLSDKIPNEKIWQRIATKPQNKNTTYFHLYKV